ncbi:hypothetical protein ACFL1P_00030 [Patescibacteria group bacterium]
MDPIQLVIIIVSLSLTALILLLGIQVFFILREFRRSIEKVNNMLNDVGKISASIGGGMSNVSGFVNGLKTGISVISSMKNKEDKE